MKTIAINTLIRCSMVAVFSLSGIVHSNALERLDGEKFQVACKAFATGSESRDENVDKALCSAFLQGYLAGKKYFLSTEDARYDYGDRAVKTRAQGLIFRDKRLKENRYCVPEDEPVDHLAANVGAAEMDGESYFLAEDVVETVLRKHYQCPR